MLAHTSIIKNQSPNETAKNMKDNSKNAINVKDDDYSDDYEENEGFEEDAGDEDKGDS